MIVNEDAARILGLLLNEREDPGNEGPWMCSWN